MMTLLPPNATAQERGLELASRFAPSVDAGVQALLTFKENPPPQVLMWLVWEYGLEELLPFLPDPAAAIAQGLLWERIKGTPESVRLALSWLNLGENTAIEEEDPTTTHWHEYMVDPGGVPNGYGVLQNIVDLARVSSPVGTNLARIYHGYDLRRFKLDGSQYGDLLSDYSGIYDDALGVRLSFGRNVPSLAAFDDGRAAAVFRAIRGHFTNHKYVDRVILDFSDLDDVPVRNYKFMHSHLFEIAGQGVTFNQPVADIRIMPKAAVIPSDSWVLGDTNSTLFAFETFEVGAPSPLSDGLQLSGQPWSFVRVPIDERIDRDTPSAGLFDGSTLAAAETSQREHGNKWFYEDRTLWDFGRLDEPVQRNHPVAISKLIIVQGQGVNATQTGADTRTVARALVALSDGVALGDTNASLSLNAFSSAVSVQLGGTVVVYPTSERIDRETESRATFDGANQLTVGIYTRGHVSRSRYVDRVILDEIGLDEFIGYPAIDGKHGKVHGSAAVMSGQFWSAIPWLNKTWGEIYFEVRVKHYGDSA